MDEIDLVDPLFMWLSPIEIRVEDAKRVNRRSLERPRSLVHQRSSLIRAKDAFKKTFSGRSSGRDLAKKKGKF